jgi:hypothetical protein
MHTQPNQMASPRPISILKDIVLYNVQVGQHCLDYAILSLTADLA